MFTSSHVTKKMRVHHSIRRTRKPHAACKRHDRQTGIQTYIHTRPKLYTTPLFGWSFKLLRYELLIVFVCVESNAQIYPVQFCCCMVLMWNWRLFFCRHVTAEWHRLSGGLQWCAVTEESNVCSIEIWVSRRDDSVTRWVVWWNIQHQQTACELSQCLLVL